MQLLLIVAVLDQEEAKKFLTGKEEDKYAFFTKATELERLDRTYASIQDNIEEQCEAKDRAMQAIEGTKENAMRLKKEWEQFQELDKLEAECQQLKALYGWAYHSECSSEYEMELKKRAKLQKHVEKLSAELVEAEKTVNVTDEEEADANKKLKELLEEANEAAKKKIELEQELKLAQQPLRKKEQDAKVVVKEVAAAQKRLKGAQHRLEKARQDILNSAGNAAEEERQRTRKIAQLERDIADGKPRVDPLKDKITEELHAYEEIKPEFEAKKSLSESTERTVSFIVSTLVCFVSFCTIILTFVTLQCYSAMQSASESRAYKRRQEEVKRPSVCLGPNAVQCINVSNKL